MKRLQSTGNGKMAYINEEYITSYIRELTPKSTPLLQEIEIYAEENRVPIVQPEVGQLLRTLLRLQKPHSVLEVGTAIGYSAILMAECLRGDWSITTLERNLEVIPTAERNIGKAGFSERIKIIPGDALQTFPHLSRNYDFIFLDASKGHYMEFFNYSAAILKPGGLIVSDNVLYQGMVAEDSLVKRRKRTIVNRLREYLEHISNTAGYISSVIPLGDGVALTFKED
jgi:caffeoyl-CoA O-methyltransferase